MTSRIEARPFTSLLVANRGEIARRVFAAARGLGLRTVAVYGRVDRDAAFVADADVAVEIGDEAEGSIPYLDVSRLLEAARRAGADAVHPGYGFLAERADFAMAVADAGMTWVGPPPAVMAAMADKDAAKAAARRVNVPVVPGVEGRGLALDALAALAAREVGFPCLVKATAGGGGRGMRRVETPLELLPALEAAALEALRAFGDGTLLVERYIARGRHIEVQLLGDFHGNLVHLHERDCSVQRRHQKLIEEAPAPALDDALRERLHRDALALGREIGYTSAGTFEFLVDIERGSHHFLEVNARVQVEHPVSELLTGIDLVRWQLRVAMGEPLPWRQEAIIARGHVIEARLCAEDAARGFAPQAGTVDAFAVEDEREAQRHLHFEVHDCASSAHHDATCTGLRVDAMLGRAGRVPLHYDSMIAKVVAFGPTRAIAVARLRRALDHTRIFGITSNAAWLRAALGHPLFAAGGVTTAFSDEAAIAAEAPSLDALGDEALIAAALWLHEATVRRRFRSNPHRPDVTVLALRHDAGQRVHVALELRGDNSFACGVDRAPDAALARPLALPSLARTCGRDSAGMQLEIDGVQRRVWLHGAGDALWLQVPGGVATCLVEGSLLPWPEAPTLTAGALTARSPALVVAVHVAVGDEVEAGSPLLTLEAMKMLSVVRAEEAGVVAAIEVVAGQGVAAGAALVQVVASAAVAAAPRRS